MRRRGRPSDQGPLAPGTPSTSQVSETDTDTTDVSSARIATPGSNRRRARDPRLSPQSSIRRAYSRGREGASVRALLSTIALLLFAILVAELYDHRGDINDHLQVVKDHINAHTNFTYALEVLNLPGVNFSQYYNYEARERPGLAAAKGGLRGKHPFFMIPGFTTTGLEVWQGAPCAKKYFRERFWGTLTMMQTFLLDKQCWIQHLKLDPATGLDPRGIKLRPSQGLEAVDYFMPGYFVWGRLIESLADIGYDSNNMHSAPYDWRLGLRNLEERDAYFSSLKASLEVSLKKQGEKALVATHSFGDTVFRYFMAWVESPRGGGGGRGWVDKHITVWCNIGGPTLGVPKAVTALLSGETRDITELQGLQWYLADWSLPQSTRTDLFRSWGSLVDMMPAGGDLVWGGGAAGPAPEDPPGSPAESRVGPFIRVAAPGARQGGKEGGGAAGREGGKEEGGGAGGEGGAKGVLEEGGDLSMEGAMRHLFETVPAVGRIAARSRSFGADVGARDDSPLRWANAVEMPLPDAPGMRIYAHYGYGKATERAYHYYPDRSASRPAASDPAGDPSPGRAGEGGGHPEQGAATPFAEEAVDIAMVINKTLSDPARLLFNGVRVVDGDGTVPLLSLGYMCARGWSGPRLNPAGIPCTIREYLHSDANLISAGGVQGGPDTADHVNIMGNFDMMADILTLAAGGEVGEKVGSAIRDIAGRVPLNRHLG